MPTGACRSACSTGSRWSLAFEDDRAAVDRSAEHVRAEGARQVDIVALFLATGVGHHGRGSSPNQPRPSSTITRPFENDQARAVPAALDRQRRHLAPRHVSADFLDVVNAARGQQGSRSMASSAWPDRLEAPSMRAVRVDIPVPARRGRLGRIPARTSSRGAGRAIWACAVPEYLGHTVPRAVVQVESVDVDADTHQGKLAPVRGYGRLLACGWPPLLDPGADRRAEFDGAADRAQPGRAISSQRQGGWRGPHRLARREGT